VKKEYHMKVDKFFWNDGSEDVHEWIDSSFPKYGSHEHWLEYHHQDAIKEKYGQFTYKYNVAYLHILTDYLSHFQIAFVPQGKKEAEDMLKSLGVLRKKRKASL